MLFAGILSIAHILQEARLADKVFLFRRGFHSHFLFAVDYTAEVRFSALLALKKADFCFGECSQVVIVDVARVGQALVLL